VGQTGPGCVRCKIEGKQDEECGKFYRRECAGKRRIARPDTHFGQQCADRSVAFHDQSPLAVAATQTRPNLDSLPVHEQDPETVATDSATPTIVLMAQFRRLRQGTCALLRSLPDDAWTLQGSSRRETNVSVRELAEHLALHDYRSLRALDRTLDQVGAREGLAEIQKTHLDDLLKLVPDTLHL